ncbi:hypothetical protein KUL156_09480 [Alteromonas sp. KUL156]|nr:hypothetical protein KUL156_09480 [Alteromonas sp. KUL156]
MNKALNDKNKALELAVNQAQALSSKLVSLQEDERRRLSRDLHDDFGHRIVDLKLQLTLNKQIVGQDTLLSKIDSLYQAMKKSLGSLRPSGIDTLSIEAVIQGSAIISTLKKSDIDYSLKVEGSPFAFDAERKIHIYRVIQEAVSNSIKYANASRLTIEINYTETKTVFRVSDNGNGIPSQLLGASTAGIPPLSNSTHSATLGLLIMKERAKLIKGNIRIDTRPSTGTTVYLTVPNL